MRPKVFFSSPHEPLIGTDTIVVAKHNTRESCWVILYGKVYDVRL